MNRDTEAQIARVIFEAIADGKPVTDAQRSQLAGWIQGKKIPGWDATPDVHFTDILSARDYDNAPTDPHHGGKIWDGK